MPFERLAQGSRRHDPAQQSQSVEQVALASCIRSDDDCQRLKLDLNVFEGFIALNLHTSDHVFTPTIRATPCHASCATM